MLLHHKNFQHDMQTFNVIIGNVLHLWMEYPTILHEVRIWQPHYRSMKKSSEMQINKCIRSAGLVEYSKLEMQYISYDPRENLYIVLEIHGVYTTHL